MTWNNRKINFETENHISQLMHRTTSVKHTQNQHWTYYLRDPIFDMNDSILHYWSRYRYRVPDKVSVASSVTYFLSSSPPTVVDVPLLLHIEILQSSRAMPCHSSPHPLLYLHSSPTRAMIYFRKWNRKMLHRSNFASLWRVQEPNVAVPYNLHVFSVLSRKSTYTISFVYNLPIRENSSN